MRVAIVSSPRSGNTWVRAVLASALSIQEIAVHDYHDLPDHLPDDCCLQLHWYREPHFQKFLSEQGFRVIVLARHPLDVLVSALHFAQYEPDVARWLDGNTELPGALLAKSPSCPEFLAYATEWGAENLLAVTYQWWHDAHCFRIRYEDLVSNPELGFQRILSWLHAPTYDLAAAVERFDLPFFQGMKNKHGWRGQPGLWRKLVPTTYATRIVRRHRRVFQALDYPQTPALLSRTAARRNWRKLSS